MSKSKPTSKKKPTVAPSIGKNSIAKRLRQFAVPPSDSQGSWYRLGTWSEPGPFPVILLLGVLALITYSNSFNCGFVLDNSVIIPKDPRLQVVSWRWDDLVHNNLNPIFTQNYWYPYLESDLYRPLTTFSYLINRSILGDPTQAPVPLGFHIVNLLLHWVNAAMFFWLVRSTVKNAWAAIFVAALYVVHPLNVESVTNLVGRADQLATFCVLAGLNLHISAYRHWGAHRGLALVGLMLVAFCGMLCKESAVVLVATMPLYDLCFPPDEKNWSLRSIWDRFVELGWVHYVCIIPAVIALMGVRYYIYRYSPVFDQIGVDNPIVFAPDFWTARMTAIRVIGYYLYLLLWPDKLSCDYSYNELPLFGWSFTTLEDWYAWLSLLMVIGLLAIWVWSFFRSRTLCFYMGFGIVAFLPTSNLLLIIGQEIGERFMYMPLIGVFGGLAVVLARITRPLVAGRWGLSPESARLALTALAIVVVSALATRSFVRNLDWRTEVTLWQSAREICPNSFKVHKGLALAMVMERPNDLATIEAAIPIALQGLAILDEHKGSDEPLPLVHLPSQLFLDLSRYYVGKGDLLAQHAGVPEGKPYGPAQDSYHNALAILNRAAAMDRAVNQQSRESRLKRGASPEEIVDVGNYEVYLNLGVVHSKLGQSEEALADAKAFRRLRPQDPVSYVQAMGAFSKMSRYDDAVVELIQAMMLGDVTPERWKNLAFFYNILSPNQPAIDYSKEPPSLQLANPTVRRHVVRASNQLFHTFVNTKRYNLATSFREKAIKEYEVPPEYLQSPALDKVLNR